MHPASEAPETAPLKAFQALLEDPAPHPEILEKAYRDLETAGLLEHALALTRQASAKGPWEAFRARLKAGVARSRERRMARWQTDPERRTLRLQVEIAGEGCALHPPALLAQMAAAFLAADLPLAMGLEKTPRPAIQLGHPLPLGVPGRAEWADACFTRALPVPLPDLPALVAPRLPAGVRLLKAEPVPNHASPVADLCRAGEWRWEGAAARVPGLRERVAAFLAAGAFELEKPGKTAGHKGMKKVDVRGLVEAMAWDGDDLRLRIRILPGQALNPKKLLAAVAGLEPEAVQGLERLEVLLAEDPRLLRPDRYQPKLHNMYEDAVLLDAGGHITLVEGDDDDPIVIGG